MLLMKKLYDIGFPSGFSKSGAVGERLGTSSKRALRAAIGQVGRPGAAEIVDWW
jgi:hypothetical protein